MDWFLSKFFQKYLWLPALSPPKCRGVDNRNLFESSRKKKITTETFNNFYKVLHFIVSSSRMSKSTMSKIFTNPVIIMLQLMHFHVGLLGLVFDRFSLFFIDLYNPEFITLLTSVMNQTLYSCPQIFSFECFNIWKKNSLKISKQQFYL